MYRLHNDEEGVAAADGAPDLFFLNAYLKCASGSASQQGVAAPDGAPDFCFPPQMF
jgi:hypothetical protein